jgi:hypothetical protein
MNHATTGRHAKPEPTFDHSEYHSVGFTPAPPGWTIVALDEHGRVGTQPLPGWLVQEEVAYGEHGPKPESLQSSRPHTRVVAAAPDLDELIPVCDIVWGFWYVAPPGAPQPTPARIQTEMKHRESLTRAHARAMGETKQ